MYWVKNARLWDELLYHWLPILIIPFEVTQQSLTLLLISLVLYYILHGFDNIVGYYSDTNKTVKEIFMN